MYLVDFFRNLFKKNNIGTIIFLIMNVWILLVFFSASNIKEVLTVLGIYVFSLAIALSPLGEIILRWQQGCKKITRQDILQKIDPIFIRVYENAKKQNPSIADGIKLFLHEEKAPNAFATGRKTICITRGLLELPDDQIEATLAHEFGHLANKDTDVLLVITVGNLIVTFLFVFFRVIFNIFGIVAGIASRSLGTMLMTIFIDFFLGAAMWVWTKIGTALVLYSNRKNEFEADKFAYNLGYGYGMATVLDTIAQNPPAHGLWKALYSTHPNTDERIGKLQEMGVDYKY